MSLLTHRSRSHRSPESNNPHNPVFDYAAEVDVFSLQGDVLIEVHEQHLHSAYAYPLGQVIVPLAWLLDVSATASESSNLGDPLNRSLVSWFEVLPVVEPTPFNNGGQYRPYIAGLPRSTGYGLARTYADKPIGFLKISCQLRLHEPILTSMLKNPWVCRAITPQIQLQEDDFAISAVYVAGYTIMDIYRTLTESPVLKKIKDVLNWKAHWALSLIVFYGFSYTALLAAPWQYPIMAFLFLLTIALALGSDQRSEEERLQKGTCMKDAERIDDPASKGALLPIPSYHITSHHITLHHHGLPLHCCVLE